MSRLKDKVAIITGAAGGMGLATARLFAEEGAKVVATDVQAELLQKEVSAIDSTGENVIGLVMDVTSPEGWQKVVDQTVKTFGKVDILVNNAGIFVNKGLMDTDMDSWNRLMAINATGVFLGMKTVVPAMQANGSGSIVNIASIAALSSGDADGGGAAYSASKGAVRSVSRHVAENFAEEKIRVNSIYPGPVYTPLMSNAGYTWEAASKDLAWMCPLPPHVGKAIDIAYGVLYFASDESQFVTGAELVIDGGYMTR